MKSWVIVLVAVAALVGGWWWWRRRAGQPLLPAVVSSNVGDPLQAYFDSLFATSSGLPPLAPTDNRLHATTVQIGGIVGQKATVDLCIAKGGDPKLCGVLAPLGSKVGEWVGDKAYDLGGAAKKGLKAIVPFWG